MFVMVQSAANIENFSHRKSHNSPKTHRPRGYTDSQRIFFMLTQYSKILGM